MANLTPQEREAREQVRYLDEQALRLKNLLSLKRQVSKAEKEASVYNKLSAKLSAQQTQNARDYAAVTANIEALEKSIQTERNKGTQAGNRAAKQLENSLRNRKATQASLLKTEGGYIEMQSQAAQKKIMQLNAERALIKDINKQRTVGGRIMDLFRSKEARQRQIDIARARAGGGANIGGTGGKNKEAEAAASGGGIFAALAAAVKKVVGALKAPFIALGKVMQQALAAPLNDAAALLTGEDFGMGGGKVKTGGVSSILGGVQQLAGAIPFIGGLLSPIVGAFKSIVEAMLGIEQGMFKFGRSLNLSYGQAQQMRNSFVDIAKSSGHIAINETRIMQSQSEIGNQLGVNRQLSDDILKNDVLLRDVLGMEVESRQSLVNLSLTSNQNAIKLTKNLMGTVGTFNKITGTSFTFNGIMKEASKLTGVIGLQFSKYPEKIAKTLMLTKNLGLEMQQLDGIANSMLDFESSISAEMEAQVITGREMNLTFARQAALNNDYATLTQEIIKNVGGIDEFLGSHRISQEAIAKSVGLEANALADILRKQKMYSALNATDEKTFIKKFQTLEKEGKKREELIQMLGEQGYADSVALSTAERITEVIETMKRTFIELIKNTGIFDFITKPERVNAFIKGVADRIAGAISIVGRIVASLMEAFASIVSIFSSGQAKNLRSLAGTVRSGAGSLSEGIRASTANLGGTPPISVGETMQNNYRSQTGTGTQQNTTGTGTAAGTASTGTRQNTEVNFYLDTTKVATKVLEVIPSLQQSTAKK